MWCREKNGYKCFRKEERKKEERLGLPRVNVDEKIFCRKCINANEDSV